MARIAREDAVVAAFDSHLEAEAAIKELQQAGIDLKRLSIIGKDFRTEERAVGFYASGDRMQVWGAQGALWGSLWGMLVGGAFFLVPGVGPLVVLGPLAGWIAGALEGAVVGGAGGVLAAGLSSLGVPEASVVKYELEVKAGKFLVIVHGGPALVEQARSVLARAGALHVDAHAALTTRDAILGLLSDEEVARVSTAETAPRLAVGDEFLDLEQLDLGVRRAPAMTAPMGQVLPRKAVHERTWTKILAQLALPAATAIAPPARP